ncbi:hypothetical protein HY989_06170 [Candidatus Micrarchaeota archaeon]|nr:hypothetical protein [Candidatus Micrarchaeota archaeon]
MGKEGRKNPGGIGDLHSHLERMKVPDEIRKKVSENREEARQHFDDVRRGEGSGMIGFLMRFGLGGYGAIRITQWLMEHHRDGAQKFGKY